MSRYIDAEWLNKYFKRGKEYKGEYVLDDLKYDAPSIDLDDYVPKEFHNKTCEAMAKRHQEEIADMVRVVRCRECKWASPNKEGDYDCKCHIPIFRVDAEGYCYLADRKESE